jgi:hypothetical protein
MVHYQYSFLSVVVLQLVLCCMGLKLFNSRNRRPTAAAAAAAAVHTAWVCEPASLHESKFKKIPLYTRLLLHARQFFCKQLQYAIGCPGSISLAPHPSAFPTHHRRHSAFPPLAPPAALGTFRLLACK